MKRTKPEIIQKTVTRRVFTCLRCGHEWVSTKTEGLPLVCAHCKSPYWNRPRTRPQPASQTT